MQIFPKILHFKFPQPLQSLHVLFFSRATTTIPALQTSQILGQNPQDYISVGGKTQTLSRPKGSQEPEEYGKHNPDPELESTAVMPLSAWYCTN